METVVMEREMNSVELEAAQRAVAIAQFKLFEREGLNKGVRALFERDGKLMCSKRAPVARGRIGLLCSMNAPSAVTKGGVPFADIVADFERRTGHLVYHVAYEDLLLGEVLYLLYECECLWLEWLENPFLSISRNVCVYVEHLSGKASSGYRLYRFSVSGGGLIRTV